MEAEPGPAGTAPSNASLAPVAPTIDTEIEKSMAMRAIVLVLGLFSGACGGKDEAATANDAEDSVPAELQAAKAAVDTACACVDKMGAGSGTMLCGAEIDDASAVLKAWSDLHPRRSCERSLDDPFDRLSLRHGGCRYKLNRLNDRLSPALRADPE